MKVIAGRVVDGKVDVSAAGVQDGTTIGVLIPDGASYELTEEDEDELQAAMDEIDRTGGIDGWQVLREIRAISGK